MSLEVIGLEETDLEKDGGLTGTLFSSYDVNTIAFLKLRRYHRRIPQVKALAPPHPSRYSVTTIAFLKLWRYHHGTPHVTALQPSHSSSSSLTLLNNCYVSILRTPTRVNGR